jgi:hypothetical protein
MLPLPSSLLLAATSAAVLLVLCSLPVASARPLTSCSFISSDGSYFDFSELHSEGSDGVRVGSSDEAATVFVNLCGRTMIAPACVNVDAAVCLQYHSDPTWYAIAESSWHDPPVFSLIKPGRSEKGVRASYRNGFTKGAKPAAVGVDLICSDAESPQYSIRHTSEHAWRLTITGRAACPKPRNVCHVELKDGTMFDLNGLRTKNGAFVKTNSSAVFNISQSHWS